MNKQRIGFLGGTFDPVHIGHLILAEEARYQLDLDRVYFVPAGDPPHKSDQHLSPVDDRIRMVELAIADNPLLQLSRIDADRPGPHYTADAVRLIYQDHEPATQIYFLMGLDSLRDLPTWHEAEWLVSHCRLVALSRHDVELKWEDLEAALPGLSERVILLDMPELEIASHTLRDRQRRGLPIRYQVPACVEAYIRSNRLYTAHQ